MSRELRARLESAQAQAKSLRESLASNSRDVSSPLPEDLSMIQRLTASQETLQNKITTASERARLVCADRDEAARKVLRLEPIGALGYSGIPPALVLGAVSGLASSWWWYGTRFSLTWPRLAAALAMSASALVLLRGAWHSGRVTGARSPR